MNILLICNQNTAGVLYTLMEGINKFTEHNCRLIQCHPGIFNYPQDLNLVNPLHINHLGRLAKVTDVFHFNIGDYRHYYGAFDFKPYLKNKLIIKHYHGTYLRLHPDIILKDTPSLVSTLDLMDYAKQYLKEDYIMWLPNPINNDLIKPMINKIHMKPFRISHFGTANMTIREYKSNYQDYKDHRFNLKNVDHRNLKHTNFYKTIIKELKEKKYNLISHHINNQKYINHDIILKLKQSCHVYFDQLWFGVYGVNAIESLCQGTVTLCRLSEFVIPLIKKYYPGSIPIINCNEFNLKNKIIYLYNNPEEVEAIGMISRDWCIKVHGYKNVVKKYIEFIDKWI